jgi:hypothetical protein
MGSGELNSVRRDLRHPQKECWTDDERVQMDLEDLDKGLVGWGDEGDWTGKDEEGSQRRSQLTSDPEAVQTDRRSFAREPGVSVI